MVSLLSITRSGDAIETGIVGSDGIVGGSCAIDGGTTLGQATVQLDATAMRMNVRDFISAYRDHEHLRTLVNKYQIVLLVQAQHNAACHALHSVNSRLCRWLLQSQDMIGSNEVYLTQEFLSHMLGVRRNTVSVEAHILQKAGLVRYARAVRSFFSPRSGAIPGSPRPDEMVRQRRGCRARWSCLRSKPEKRAAQSGAPYADAV
jgi:CRP-like cAMP-binding protein